MVSRDHKLSMRKQCQLLQLSRSRLYYQPVGESAKNLRFMEIIDKQFLETSWYGSRQMARYMKRNNHQCGRHRVRRLMRLMRLVPIYQEPNTSKKHPQHRAGIKCSANTSCNRSSHKSPLLTKSNKSEMSFRTQCLPLSKFLGILKIKELAIKAIFEITQHQTNIWIQPSAFMICRPYR